MNHSERSAFYRYRLLARFAEILPVSGIRLLASLAGRTGPLLNKRQAALVRSNLRRVMQHEPSPSDVRKTYASYISYWLNAFHLPVVPREHLEQLVTIDGMDHLDAARQAGKGVILAVPHVGNWDVAGAWLASRGLPLLAVAERLQPAELHKWFEDFRTSLGLGIAVNGPDIGRTLIDALRRNDVVALLCDRDVDGSGALYEFFGEETKLPRGPAMLALRTGAVLLSAAAYEEGDGFRIVIDSPVSTERSAGPLRVDVDRVTNDLMRRVEALIRRDPTQWHLFQPNWPSDRQNS